MYLFIMMFKVLLLFVDTVMSKFCDCILLLCVSILPLTTTTRGERQAKMDPKNIFDASITYSRCFAAAWILVCLFDQARRWVVRASTPCEVCVIARFARKCVYGIRCQKTSEKMFSSNWFGTFHCILYK